MSCDYCSLPPNRCQCVQSHVDAVDHEASSVTISARPRLLSAPVIPDHMHWYRVIGAVYLRWQACETWQSVPRWLP